MENFSDALRVEVLETENANASDVALVQAACRVVDLDPASVISARFTDDDIYLMTEDLSEIHVERSELPTIHRRWARQKLEQWYECIKRYLS
ncbi:hypothetical protein LCGC14_1614260 [marine sediment metagenome]|uniref:Uncharacterized protein n=1 Tax=marine sediment metagenome TaxID=412755 RepID=A0A0F9KN32_9ZZZZ